MSEEERVEVPVWVFGVLSTWSMAWRWWCCLGWIRDYDGFIHYYGLLEHGCFTFGRGMSM